MIDAAGEVTLFRRHPEDVWHVVELRDGKHLVAPCGAMLAEAKAEQLTIPLDRLLRAGRICLPCAQALLSVA